MLVDTRLFLTNLTLKFKVRVSTSLPIEIDRDSEIRKVQERTEQQVRLKEKEILSTSDKIQQAKKDLNSMLKRSKMTESEKVVELEQKIVGVEMKTKDVIKEIKNLKKIQHD